MKHEFNISLLGFVCLKSANEMKNARLTEKSNKFLKSPVNCRKITERLWFSLRSISWIKISVKSSKMRSRVSGKLLSGILSNKVWANSTTHINIFQAMYRVPRDRTSLRHSIKQSPPRAFPPSLLCTNHRCPCHHIPLCQPFHQLPSPSWSLVQNSCTKIRAWWHVHEAEPKSNISYVSDAIEEAREGEFVGSKSTREQWGSRDRR